MTRFASLLLAVALAACGDSHTAGDAGADPGDAGAPPDAPSLDSGVDPADAGPPCDFAATLERGCADDTDCVVGVHQTDCCGNTTALGIHRAERDRFDALEPICRASYPGCGCPSGPTTTDTGETAFDPGTIQVACVIVGTGRMCRTYVATRPSDGR